MDDRDLALEFDDLDEEMEGEVDIGVFYWALKAALDRPPVEISPASS